MYFIHLLAHRVELIV